MLDSLTLQKYTTNTPSLRVRKRLLGVLSGNGDRKHANSTIVSWEISAEAGQATKGWRQKPKRPNQNVKIVGSLNMNMNVSSGATSTRSQAQDELPWQTAFVWTLRHRHPPTSTKKLPAEIHRDQMWKSYAWIVSIVSVESKHKDGTPMSWRHWTRFYSSIFLQLITIDNARFYTD